MSIKVVNKYNHTPTIDDVYIGRGSIWGNPFVIGKDGNRENVIIKYENMILNNNDLLSQIDQLKHKILVCYCSPKKCHGDVLKRLCEEVRLF